MIESLDDGSITLGSDDTCDNQDTKYVEDTTLCRVSAVWNGSTGRVTAIEVPGSPPIIHITPYNERNLEDSDEEQLEDSDEEQLEDPIVDKKCNEPTIFIIRGNDTIIEDGKYLKSIENITLRRVSAVWNGSTGRVTSTEVLGSAPIIRIFPYTKDIIDKIEEDKQCMNCDHNQNHFGYSVKCREFPHTRLSFDGDGGIDEDKFYFMPPNSFVCPKHSDKK